MKCIVKNYFSIPQTELENQVREILQTKEEWKLAVTQITNEKKELQSLQPDQQQQQIQRKLQQEISGSHNIMDSQVSAVSTADASYPSLAPNKPPPSTFNSESIVESVMSSYAQSEPVYANKRTIWNK
jgi:hypothetical protein